MRFKTIIADRRLYWTVGGLVALIVLALLGLAAFPWGSLKSTVESRMSKSFGRPVTIGRIDRLDGFSFSPTIAIHDMRIPQAEWVGTGDLATIRAATVRFSVFPLLTGNFRPESIDVSGLRLNLVRAKDGRENWRQSGSDESGPVPRLTALRIVDSIISYRDAKVGRSFTVKMTADSAKGIVLNGKGEILGAPVALSAKGAAIENVAGRLWPFEATIEGPRLGMRVIGKMDSPLDASAMTIDLTARADDLKMIDAVIEAGLFGTQDVRLKAHARQDGLDWTITKLSGTIGQSDIAGGLTVRRRGGRTLLDGDVVSNRLNFDDFASDAGLAKAAALEQSIGLRLVPNTRINIVKIDDTDGDIRFNVRQVIGGKRPSSVTSLRGSLKLDHQLLVVAPLAIGLKQGTITGSMRVDQRGGVKVPMVTIDLKLSGSSVGALAGGGGAVDGRVDARANLSGPGSTIREAVGNANGSIGLVARDGGLPAKVAAMIGFDASRALTSDDDERAGLRCIVLRLDMRRGVGRVDPLVLDTTLSQSNGQGSVSFPSEALAITLTGAPKQKSVLRLPGSVTVAGTIRDPDIAIPPKMKSVGNVLKAIGRSITGNQGPKASDADCVALSARALGGG
ncbi:AsmA family protein [Sphingomonas sp. So64.6b]|uniref:AsmA family protein n=1 Tax=Sphingomonas sp. So64.6b TaxID=2997354 RepID=UPI001FCEE05D|nr:AsmA family protein [Sphingomonas sp. So64.6b]